MNVLSQQARRLTTREIAKWCLWTLIPIAGVYRILTFVPQPLDSSGTLRPHLYYWFTAFFKSQASWTTICFWLLPIPAVLALLNYFSVGRPQGRIRRVLCSRTLLFAAVAVLLFTARLPVLLAGQLNPDEAQFLAAAQKLFVDPNFFRAVDCGTSGPFNIFPLMLPSVLGLSPDFASERIIGLLLIFSSVYTLYRAFCLIVDDAQARVAILPAAGAFAVLKYPDFLHYSSEHVALLLVSLAVFLCAKVIAQPGPYAWCVFGLGLLTSAAFFAKMQAVPVIAAVALVAMAFVYRTANARGWWRPVALFIAGAAPLHVINAVACLYAGVWNDFWMAYIVTNYQYEQMPAQGLSQFVNFVLSVREIRIFVVALVAVGAVYAFPPMRRQQAERWFGVATATLIAASLFVVYAPHRPFQHYLLFLVIPLNVAMAWPMLVRVKGATSRQETPLVLLFITLTMTCQAILQAAPFPFAFANRPEIRSPESDYIRSITQPKDEIVVWGWNPNPYLGSGRVSATRDLNMVNQMLADRAVAEFYQGRFLRDMRRTRPRLFVDAVEGTSFGWQFVNRRTGGFELIPAIHSYVQSNYALFKEAYGQRFYSRRNIALPIGPLLTKCDASAIRCFDGTPGASATDLPPIRMPEHAVVEVVFTPETKQELYATVFSNDASPKEQKGFQFHHVGDDLYDLAVGLDGKWVLSKVILVAQKTPATLSFEFNGKKVTIRYDDVVREEMELPRRMADTDAPITIGSWIGGQRPFAGKVQVLQIRDLGTGGRK